MRVKWLYKFYKPQTAISAKRHLAAVEKKLGDPIAENLTLQYVESHLTDGRNIVPVTYNEMLKHLKSLLRWTMKQDLIPTTNLPSKFTRMHDRSVKEADRGIHRAPERRHGSGKERSTSAGCSSLNVTGPIFTTTRLRNISGKQRRG